MWKRKWIPYSININLIMDKLHKENEMWIGCENYYTPLSRTWIGRQGEVGR